MSSCPGLLSPRECNKGAPGLVCAYFCHCPSHIPREVVLFGTTLAVVSCHLCAPLGVLTGNLGSLPQKSVQMYPYMRCELRVYSLYTGLQLSLGICTRWLLWDLNQRIVALHSSSDMCMLFLPSPEFS